MTAASLDSGPELDEAQPMLPTSDPDPFAETEQNVRSTRMAVLAVGVLVAAAIVFVGWLVLRGGRGGGPDMPIVAHAMFDGGVALDDEPAVAVDAAVTPVVTDVPVVVDAGAVRPDAKRRRSSRPKPDLPQPDPDPPPDPGPLLPDAGPQYGFLTVAAEPYALVHLDGREIGATPIFRRKVTVGKHQVKLMSPDTGNVRLTKTVVIKVDALSEVIAN